MTKRASFPSLPLCPLFSIFQCWRLTAAMPPRSRAGRKEKDKAPTPPTKLKELLAAELKNVWRLPAAPGSSPLEGTSWSCGDCKYKDRGGCRNKTSQKNAKCCPCDRQPVSTLASRQHIALNKCCCRPFSAAFLAPSLSSSPASHARPPPPSSRARRNASTRSARSLRASGTRRPR